MRKNTDIEVLRALAVVVVILHHAHGALIFWSAPAPLQTFFTYFRGSVGVDLFFVISGFVIARGLLNNLRVAQDSGQVGGVLKAFWVRRIFRIFPLAWFWLAFILFATLVLNETGVFHSFRANWEGTVAAVLQVANFRFEACFANFDCGANFVYWSLSLEEQFYIALPLLAILLRQYLTAFLLVCLAYKFWSVPLAYHFGFRVEGLLLGVLLAIWSDKPSYGIFEPRGLLHSPWPGFVTFLGLSILLVSIKSPELHTVPLVMQDKVVALVAALMVWLASYDKNYLMPFSWFKACFLWAGSRSYALYLVHIPAFYLTRELWFRFTGSEVPQSADLVFYFATAFFFLVFFSEASFRLIETPMRNKGIGISSRILKNSAPVLPPDQVRQGTTPSA